MATILRRAGAGAALNDVMPLPFGWYQVAYADDLSPEDVRVLRFFGRDLVLFRTEAGDARLLDAHCPHLGAHLGVGGTVVGEALRCPFHAWAFDGTGRCVDVPYAKRIPPRAEVGAWHLVERNRVLWAWFHPEGSPPAWELPEIPEAADPSWSAFDRHFWHVRTHNQEIGENGVDRAHFRYVHGTTKVPDSELHVDGHHRRALQRVSYDTPRGPVDGAIEVNAYGMGCTVTRFTGICETLLIISHTPVEAGLIASHFSFTQPLGEDGQPVGGRAAAALVREIVRQMEQDIPIWEHKVYHPQPLLCDGDGPIGAYRRWAAQFYV